MRLILVFMIFIVFNVHAEDYKRKYNFNYGSISIDNTNTVTTSSAAIDYSTSLLKAEPIDTSLSSYISTTTLPEACIRLIDYKSMRAEADIHYAEEELRVLLMRTVPSFDDIGCTDRIVSKISALADYMEIEDLIKAIQGLASIVDSLLKGNFAVSAEGFEEYVKEMAQTFYEEGKEKLCQVALDYLDTQINEYNDAIYNVKRLSDQSVIIYNIASQPEQALEKWIKDQLNF